MCSHYQTLKDAELLLKKFGVRDKPAALGMYDAVSYTHLTLPTTPYV